MNLIEFDYDFKVEFASFIVIQLILISSFNKHDENC